MLTKTFEVVYKTAPENCVLNCSFSENNPFPGEKKEDFNYGIRN